MNLEQTVEVGPIILVKTAIALGPSIVSVLEIGCVPLQQLGSMFLDFDFYESVCLSHCFILLSLHCCKYILILLIFMHGNFKVCGFIFTFQ